MQTVSETGYLLPLYQRWLSLVKFFFFSVSCFFDAHSLRPQIMIGWARVDNRWRKAGCPSPGRDRYRIVTSAAESLFTEENAWATQ